MEDKNIDFNHLDLDLNKYQYDDIVGINVDEIADNSSIKNEPVLPDFEQSSALDILFNPDMEKKSDVEVATDAPMIFSDEMEQKKDDFDLWQNISFDGLHFAPDETETKSKRELKRFKKAQRKQNARVKKDQKNEQEEAPEKKETVSPLKESKASPVAENKFAVNSDLFNEIKAKQKKMSMQVSADHTSDQPKSETAAEKPDTIKAESAKEDSVFEDISTSQKRESSPLQSTIRPDKNIRADVVQSSSDDSEIQTDDVPKLSNKHKPRVIDDYSSDGEREDVLADLKSTLRKITAKSVWMFFFFIASCYFTVGKISYFQFIFPTFLNPSVSAKNYCIASLALTSIVFIINISPLLSGLKNIFRAKLSTDGMLFFFGIGLISLDVYYVLNPDIFSSYLIHFDFLFVFGILMNLLAKKRLVRNIYKNFEMVSTDRLKTVVCGPSNLPINNDIMMETGNGGDVIYLEKTKIVSDFLRRSFKELEQTKAVQTLYFLITMLSIIVSVALFAAHKLDPAETFLLFVSCFALSTPVFSAFSYSFMVYRISAILRSINSMITGTSDAKVLSDSGILVTTDDELISGLDVKLLSMQLRNGCDPSELLINMSALFRTVGKALGDLFYNVLDKKSTIQLPEVKNIYCYDRLGYTALINDKKIAVGNAEFMRRLSVDIYDEKTSDAESYIYASTDGILTGVFTVRYELSSATKNAISILDHQGYSLAVVATDFNINEKMFYDTGLEHPDMVTILSFSTAKECKNLCSERKTAPAAVVSFDGVRGVASAISGGNSLLICRILQNSFSVTASIFGWAAAVILSVLFDGAGFWIPFITAVYQLLWAIPSFVIARCSKF